MTRSDNHFGDHLYTLRQARGWSLREAARRAGVSFSRLGEIERGIDPHNGKRFVPSYPVVCRLARAYDVPADELLELAGHVPGPELTPEEWRLLAAYRRMPLALRPALLRALNGYDGEETVELGQLIAAEQTDEGP